MKEQTDLLATISSPADLKALDLGQLDRLCQEIREFIVDKVNQSKAGGHLGSNLGIVELTVAMHRVLNSPEDVILFDTGHQAYVHKILTGRTGEFDSLRTSDGLSGYPSRDESDHDWIENSHASTALAYAHGLAIADRTTDPESQRRIVAVIGDGSMTGGMAFEGLNNLGHDNANVTIVLNDNGRSYAPTVSLLSDSLIKIRSNPVYMKRQRLFEEFTSDLPVVGRLSERGIRAWKAAIREAFEPHAFFEPLGVRYMGPFDGHDIAELETALSNAGDFPGPVVVHVETRKGRGYGPAENDPIKNMHDIGAVKPGSYTAAFSETMIKLGEQNPNLVAITAAMPDSTGLLPFGERFGDRLIDVGIAEQHAVTAAAGMAMGGLRPVVALYSTFLSRAFDQMNLDVGLHRQPVIFCLDRAGITGDDGPSHHGILDMVLMRKVAGMTIFAPSSYQELQQMLTDAIDITTGPVGIRWPKTPAPSVGPDDIGYGLNARQVRSATGGTNTPSVCLIGVGKMLTSATDAADILAAAGIEASVWDARVVQPVDPKLAADAARHDIVVTIEDGLSDGGAGTGIVNAVKACVADGGLSEPRFRVLGIPTSYIPQAKPDQILAGLGLDGAGVAETIRSLVN